MMVKKLLMNRPKMRKMRRKKMRRNKAKMKKRKLNQRVRLQLKTYEQIDLNFINIINIHKNEEKETKSEGEATIEDL